MIWNRDSKAPDESDRIVVHSLPNGKFRFGGVIWNSAVRNHNDDFVEFDTQEKAREAGIAWAQVRQPAALLIEYRDAEATD